MAATYGEPSPKSGGRVTSGKRLGRLGDGEGPALAEGLAVHLAAHVDRVASPRFERALRQQGPLVGAQVAAGAQRVRVDRPARRVEQLRGADGQLLGG